MPGDICGFMRSACVILAVKSFCNRTISLAHKDLVTYTDSPRPHWDCFLFTFFLCVFCITVSISKWVWCNFCRKKSMLRFTSTTRPAARFECSPARPRFKVFFSELEKQLTWQSKHLNFVSIMHLCGVQGGDRTSLVMCTYSTSLYVITKICVYMYDMVKTGATK